mgnify:CR=1 FL=1
MPYRIGQRVTVLYLDELLLLDEPTEPGVHVQATGRVRSVDDYNGTTSYTIRLDSPVRCYHDDWDEDEDESIERTYFEDCVVVAEDELEVCNTFLRPPTTFYKPSQPRRKRYAGIQEEVVTL